MVITAFVGGREVNGQWETALHRRASLVRMLRSYHPSGIWVRGGGYEVQLVLIGSSLFLSSDLFPCVSALCERLPSAVCLCALGLIKSGPSPHGPRFSSESLGTGRLFDYDADGLGSPCIGQL